MTRKMMTREVTKTTVKVGKLEMVDGQPQAVSLPEEVLLGNVSLEKAQKELNKKYGQPVTVFEVVPDTETYEMPVEEFISLAKVKEDQPKEEN